MYFLAIYIFSFDYSYLSYLSSNYCVAIVINIAYGTNLCCLYVLRILWLASSVDASQTAKVFNLAEVWFIDIFFHSPSFLELI